MQKTFLVAFAIGIGCIAIVVSGVVYMQRGARVGLTGSVLKVRTAPLDEYSSVAVLDFRFTNPSNGPFMVRNVSVVFVDKSGNQLEGSTISELDAGRLFEGLPLLGQKFNQTLMMNERVASHASQDRMVSARFQIPEAQLEARKTFLLRIEDVDGPITEFSEK